MAKVFDEISPKLAQWIADQNIFFVSTAPMAERGHVNCSPKGGDSFRVLGAHEVAYADQTGSGIETVAHLRENGRIVVMFCAFEGGPQIVRLHGQGEVITPDHADFETLKKEFPGVLGLRGIIRIKVSRIGDSCGYAVPFYDYVGPRDVLDHWCEKKGPDGLVEYREQNNLTSIDGLPGLD